MIDAPLDHVAIVVADLAATIAFYTQTLGFSEVYREIVADQGVEAVGLRSGDAIVELLRPLDPASAIARFDHRHEPPQERTRRGLTASDVPGALAVDK